MKYIMIIALLALAGCDRLIERDDALKLMVYINHGESVCKANEGFEKVDISSSNLGHTELYCRDGAVFTYKYAEYRKIIHDIRSGFTK